MSNEEDVRVLVEANRRLSAARNRHELDEAITHVHNVTKQVDGLFTNSFRRVLLEHLGTLEVRMEGKSDEEVAWLLSGIQTSTAPT